MKNRNLFILISSLALIATLLAIWHFFLKPAKVVKIEPVPYFPSPFFSPSPPSSPSLPKKTKENIVENLPYETEGYSIQYLANTNQFFVLIKNNSYNRYKTEVLSWFKKFGIENPEEELPLFFTSARWVAPE